ncbi:MAG: family 16 glycosylhydrolase [Victivallaceae bacterium]
MKLWQTTILIFTSMTIALADNGNFDKNEFNFPKGLVLHLDASVAGSIVRENGRISKWRDLSPAGNDLSANGDYRPAYVVNAALFQGKQHMRTAKSVNCPKGISVFMVFRRREKSSAPWQCAVYWGDEKYPDSTPRFHLNMGKEHGVLPLTTFYNNQHGAFNNPLLIGSNAQNSGFLCGEIAEIAVFNRPELNAEEIGRLRNYFHKKWQYRDADWLRFGPLGKYPRRLTDKYPLSDQKNQGKWEKADKLSDEFTGKKLDRGKWTDLVSYRYGKPPVRTLPQNVIVKNGMLHLIADMNKNLPSGRFSARGEEFHTYTMGVVKSMHLIRYGYFEVRAKMLPSTMACNFWFYGRGINRQTGVDAAPEIDVYEMSAKSLRYSQKYLMTLHYVERKPKFFHYSAGSKWGSDFKFYDDFHVYGLEWTPKNIRFYIDGVLVRDYTVKKNYWDMPMIMSLDILPQFSWFGAPDKNDFPCTYYIDYVRVWKNEQTKDNPDDWNKKYTITYKPKDTGPAYDYFKQYGNTLEIPVPPEPKTDVKKLIDCTLPASAGKFCPEHEATAKLSGCGDNKNGIKLYFPPVAKRMPCGEFEHLTPIYKQPSVTVDGKNLTIDDWHGYDYFVYEYYNPQDVKLVQLNVELNNRQKLISEKIVMKSGKGKQFIKLPAGKKQAKITKITFKAAESDLPTCFYVTGLYLEKLL